MLGRYREGDPVDLYTFLKRLPKVSLHVHLAGTVQPSTLVELARKNGVTLPAYREPTDLYDYPDIYQFLTMLDLVMASVRDREDFGSAIHVMLALCRSSRQVVVAYEELHGTDMVRERLGKRQRLTYQA
jgi:adenosine deaminase